MGSTRKTQTISDKETGKKRAFNRLNGSSIHISSLGVASKCIKINNAFAYNTVREMLWSSKQIIIIINCSVASVKMLPVCESGPIIISCLHSGTDSRLEVQLYKHLRALESNVFLLVET